MATDGWRENGVHSHLHTRDAWPSNRVARAMLAANRDTTLAAAAAVEYILSVSPAQRSVFRRE